MHYSYEVEVTPDDVVSDPVVYPIVLSTGILRRVRIFFPLGVLVPFVAPYGTEQHKSFLRTLTAIIAWTGIMWMPMFIIA